MGAAVSKGPLKRVRLENHKGIVSLEVHPNGKSMRLEGANGVNKSSIIDGIEWIVSDDGSDATMRNGADVRYGEMLYGDYLITRRQKRGGKPTRNTPAAALSEVRAALSRKTFSALSEAEQVTTLKKLAPGLDTSTIDKEGDRIYAERTEINRSAKELRAQAAGVVVPDTVVVGEERPVVDVVDVAEIAGRKAPMERQRAANEAERARHRQMQADARVAHAASVGADRAALAKAIEEANMARAKSDNRAQEVVEMDQVIAALVDPDPSTIDAEINTARAVNLTARTAAEAHNRAVRTAAEANRNRQRAAEQRDAIVQRAAAKESAAKVITDRLAAIDTEKKAAVSTVKLPVTGLSIVAGRVMYDDGKAGPLPVSDSEDTPNAGERMRINIAIHAALGHKVVAIRNASLMDDDTLAKAEALAAEHGMQLIPEIVKQGQPLTIVIEDDPDTDSDWS